MFANDAQRSENSARNRVPVEMQLKAEEKWLVEALRRIRNERNSLQIERLHLESMQARLSMAGEGMSSPRPESTVDPAPVTNPAQIEVTLTPMSSRQMIEFEAPLNEEIVCNNEELDLGVSAGQLGDHFMSRYEAPYEEYDDDNESLDDSESLNDDDIEIDMNMFMNAYNHNAS